jgi:hypothetical protein
MENIKVRIVEDTEQKGVAEKEAELLAKHEKEQSEVAVDLSATIENKEVPAADGDDPSAQQDLKEEDVLSYLGKRYNKQINSFDELMAERQSGEELPEDVAAYMKYKKETGRGFEDFLKLKEDYESMDGDQLLKNYLRMTQEGLDDDDIETLMQDYKYDEDIDDDLKIKKIKIAKKKVITDAKKFFNEQKEKYKLPLESRGLAISDEEKEEFEAYREYIQRAKTADEETNRKRQWFDQKTNEVFNQEFKGFEFEVNNKKVVFSPGDSTELRKAQSTPSNFISKFLDEKTGLMKDAVGYHKSLAIAMNPDKFAKFFYDEGMAAATEASLKGIKNIDMTERRTPEIAKTTEGVQVKAMNPDSGKSLKIRSKKQV